MLKYRQNYDLHLPYLTYAAKIEFFYHILMFINIGYAIVVQITDSIIPDSSSSSSRVDYSGFDCWFCWSCWSVGPQKNQ